MKKTTSISSFVDRISEFALYHTFREVKPDCIQAQSVAAERIPSADPLRAGGDFARHCAKYINDARIEASGNPYSPWLRALQSSIRALGDYKIHAEQPVCKDPKLLRGVADLVLVGPEGCAVVEVKVITQGEIESPRSADLCQVGGYCSALKRRGTPPHAAYVAYVELSTPMVRIFGIRRHVRKLTNRFERLAA